MDSTDANTAEKMTYTVEIAETRDPIDRGIGLEQAVDAVREYEDSDRREGCYRPGSYAIRNDSTGETVEVPDSVGKKAHGALRALISVYRSVQDRNADAEPADEFSILYEYTAPADAPRRGAWDILAGCDGFTPADGEDGAWQRVLRMLNSPLAVTVWERGSVRILADDDLASPEAIASRLAGDGVTEEPLTGAVHR